MPVTAKLSRRFYDQLGDEVANELVNWFNAVDETYRNQLRELNELNWERFRSELRSESTGIRAETGTGFSSIRAEMDKRFSTIDLRLAAIDGRFAAIDSRFDAVDGELASLDARFPSFEERLETKFDAKFAQFETKMFRRMFGSWTATIIPLGALILALNGAFQR